MPERSKGEVLSLPKGSPRGAADRETRSRIISTRERFLTPFSPDTFFASFADAPLLPGYPRKRPKVMIGLDRICFCLYAACRRTKEGQRVLNVFKLFALDADGFYARMWFRLCP